MKTPLHLNNESDAMWLNAMGFVLRDANAMPGGKVWYNSEFNLSLRLDTLHVEIMRYYRHAVEIRAREEAAIKLRETLFEAMGLSAQSEVSSTGYRTGTDFVTIDS